MNVDLEESSVTLVITTQSSDRACQSVVSGFKGPVEVPMISC